MNYIILDMEWNQGYPGNSVYIKGTRQLLSGEIIQIGAVKLDEDFVTVDTYSRLVKPSFYKSLHYKVKELTGITKQDLSTADTFNDVLPDFLSWCGEKFIFLIWGFDDINILRQNIRINNSGDYEKFEWYNVQLIYNAQYHSENIQVALQTACDTLGIIQDKQLHNALHDAVYTAEVCKKLDMINGIEFCKKQNAENLENIHKKYRYYGFTSLDEALKYAMDNNNICPICAKTLTLQRPYFKQYFNQYVSVRVCEQHGTFVEHIGASKKDEKSFNSTKTLCRTDDPDEHMKKRRSRRRHGHHSPKSQSNHESKAES